MLKGVIADLQDQMALLKNGKSSKTSGTPASQDLARSNSKSLRKKSDRPTGGQFGHKGKTLEMSSTPDEVVGHYPLFCNGCGSTLHSENAQLEHRRQLIEIPPIVPKHIEHRSYSTTCTGCGTCTVADMPEELISPVQYGPTVSALVGYLNIYQYLPYQRISNLMGGIFQLPISQGTVKNMLSKLAAKATPAYQEIARKVSTSKVIGADETGTRVDNQKAWAFVWQTPSLTYIVTSFSRGFQTIMDTFPDGFPNATLLSDCLAAQLKTPSKKKQLCIAHLLRELENFDTGLNCSWSREVKGLFYKTLEIRRQMKPEDFTTENIRTLGFETRMDLLLAYDLSEKHKKIRAFAKRLIKYRDSLFTYLYNQDVPPDNNGSERAIRNYKVKNKISGSFRSEEGATVFAKLRSVVDTINKNGLDVLDAFKLLAQARFYAAE